MERKWIRTVRFSEAEHLRVVSGEKADERCAGNTSRQVKLKGRRGWKREGEQRESRKYETDEREKEGEGRYGGIDKEQE